MKSFLTTIFASIVLVACSEASKVIPSNHPYSDNDGLLFYSAWRCANLAKFAGETDQVERLFELGLDVGKGFVNRATDQSMDEEEWKKAPVGVTWALVGGPSVDFQLGQLFGSISDDVYEEVTKEDENGIPFDDVLKWRSDESRKNYASLLFRKANCSILK